MNHPAVEHLTVEQKDAILSDLLTCIGSDTIRHHGVPLNWESLDIFKVKVGDTVKILPSKDLNEFWVGQVGKVVTRSAHDGYLNVEVIDRVGTKTTVGFLMTELRKIA